MYQLYQNQGHTNTRDPKEWPSGSSSLTLILWYMYRNVLECTSSSLVVRLNLTTRKQCSSKEGMYQTYQKKKRHQQKKVAKDILLHIFCCSKFFFFFFCHHSNDWPQFTSWPFTILRSMSTLYLPFLPSLFMSMSVASGNDWNILKTWIEKMRMEMKMEIRKYFYSSDSDDSFQWTHRWPWLIRTYQWPQMVDHWFQLFQDEKNPFLFLFPNRPQTFYSIPFFNT